MIEHMYQYSNGYPVARPYTLDEMFAYNIRYQVLTYTEEQRDYLFALQLMYSRELEVETWAEWNERRIALMDTRRQKLRLLPIVFSTFKLNLRGF
ncbi:hypothetical protein D3C85_906370 [compost metagenome]